MLNEPLPKLKTTKNESHKPANNDLKQFLLTDELLKAQLTIKPDSALLIEKSLFVQELLKSLMNSSNKIH